jgi:hypothetical protein
MDTKMSNTILSPQNKTEENNSIFGSMLSKVFGAFTNGTPDQSGKNTSI